MLSRYASISAPVSARHALLISPELGAAKSSHAIAPRNGGVTNEAVTSARTAPPSGMSVRATSHPISAAKAQQMMLEEKAVMAGVINGTAKGGSVARRTKVSDGNGPTPATKLKQPSHVIGRMISTQSSAANRIRTGHDRSSLRGDRRPSAGSAIVTDHPRYQRCAGP